MWRHARGGWFYGKHIWLFIILGLWVFEGNWPLVIFLFFVAPMIYQSIVENGWGVHNRDKRKHDDDDYGRYDDYFEGEKSKRRTVYIRSSDGEFIEVPVDELEYV
jgi:hypothetical protein